MQNKRPTRAWGLNGVINNEKKMFLCVKWVKEKRLYQWKIETVSCGYMFYKRLCLSAYASVICRNVFDIGICI